MKRKSLFWGVFSAIITWSVVFIVGPAVLVYFWDEYFLELNFLPNHLFELGLFFVFSSTVFLIHLFVFFVRQGKGTPAPFVPAEKLLVFHVYKKSRNPIYLTYFILLLGEYLMFGYFIQLLYLMSFFLFFHLYVVFVEEPELRRRFGKDYEIYCEKVKRWI